MRRLAVCGLAALLLMGCGRQAPQIPSQRKGGEATSSVDSAQLALLELNQRLATSADEQLRQLAQTLEEPYALYEANTWMTILDRGDGQSGTPAYNEEWTVHMKTYDLSGQLLVDAEGTYRIGKQELPTGVDKNIGELHRHGKARLLVPWYAAYGVTGTAQIAPYENVIIEIEVK